MQNSKIAVTQLSLPKGGGAIKGMGETFQPHEFSGAASLSIPIPATPCRGFEPQLSLSYSSGSGHGPFGLGFELSLPDIARQTSNGIPKYDDTDAFLYAGDDYLVPHDNAKYPGSALDDKLAQTYDVTYFRPRTEANFDKIQRWRNREDPADTFWVVVSKDNVTHIFGKSDGAKIYDPTGPTRIFKWLLEETFDARGNHQFYEYRKEDGADIQPEIWEQNRQQTANTYLTKIKYGNDRPIEGSILLDRSHPSKIKWHFEIVFDYGEYNIDPKEATPYTTRGENQWGLRPDPFSTYEAGFEIRTYRLCRHILLFHCFKELGSAPILTNVLKLDYQPSPYVTLLTCIEHTGYRKTNKDRYETKSLPPLELKYSRFEPAEQNYVPHDYNLLSQTNGLPTSPGAMVANSQFVDLYGEGIPGLLYADGETALYWGPQQPAQVEVEYTSAQTIPFPIGRRAADATHTLTDITGNGQLDLFVSLPNQVGYYEANPDRTWKDFTPLKTYPLDYHSPYNRQVDLTGDGLADVVVIEADRVQVHPWVPGPGYGQPLILSKPASLPTSKPDAAKRALHFADMIGTGQPDLVQISNGLVECWPSLGYGRFGERVVMGNAPAFGNGFDTERLILTDVDGSGTTDLVYIYPDHVALYLNQSGNAFSDKITLPLPGRWDSLDQIQFVDVRGNGTNCLVYAQTHPVPRRWYYDFSQVTVTEPDGQTVVQSQKPHLLTEISNNMGARTHIRYASSTQFYLADKAQGLPWITILPYPVQVVESITHIDEISQTTTVSAYQYHHGYYDGLEREFRGFGRVDRTDTATFADFDLAAVDGPDEAAYHSPPLLTRTWYHTGAWLKEGDLLAQYKKEYWDGDKEAHHLPGTTFQYLAGEPDADAVPEAHRTLHGAMIRSEVYGRDGTPWQDNPYTVSESQFWVSQLQAQGQHKYGVYFFHAQESITYDYERNPADPRITHEFTLDVDDFGYVRQACSVSYGRREGHGQTLDAQTQDQQSTLRASYVCDGYVHSPELAKCDFYLLGVPKAHKQVEILGLKSEKGYLTSGDLQSRVRKALSSAESHRLLHWERYYYYDAQAQKALPFGQVTPQELHCRSEFVEFDKVRISDDYQRTLDDKRLDELLTSGDAQARGGYISYSDAEARGYYWNPGNFQAYNGAESFYLPHHVCDAFQYPFENPALKTSYEYDDHCLLVKRVTDPLGNTSKVTQIDYQALQPTSIEDINGNISEVRIDPLGMVVATSYRGQEGDRNVGFDELSNYHPVSSQGIDDIISDIITHPDKYLQGAASFFYYDLCSWMNEAQPVPVHAIELVSEDYTLVDGKANPSPPGVQKRIVYSDGFGRHLQSKAYFDAPQTVRFWDTQHQQVAEDDKADCWLTSGAVRYNNKGAVVKQYELFFSPDYVYVDQDPLNVVGFSTTLFYDPLGRLVLTQTLKGFLSKTLFGYFGDEKATYGYDDFVRAKLYRSLPKQLISSAWSTLHFDANDTVKDADCVGTVDSPREQEIERQVLQEAETFFNTPHISYEDNMGRVVQTEQLFVAGDNEKGLTYVKLDILGNHLATSDARQHLGTPAEEDHVTDIEPSPQDLELIGHNFVMKYNLSQEMVKTISADSGTHWVLHDVVGNVIYSRDSRGFEIYRAYDALHRPVQVQVQVNGGHGATPLARQTVERVIYGDIKDEQGHYRFANPRKHNLLGAPVIHFDQAGLMVMPSYTIHGQSKDEIRALRRAYQHEANWNEIPDDAITALIDNINTYQNAPGGGPPVLPTQLTHNLLEAELFSTRVQHDALGRVCRATDPDGNTTSPTYYANGWLQAVTVSAGDVVRSAVTSGHLYPFGWTPLGDIVKKIRPSAATPGIANISYNAKGQRTSITYGNGVRTSYTYDKRNHRLIGIKTMGKRGKTLQDLVYYYDPVGNITRTIDCAVATIFYNNQKIEPQARYTYDALYRLTKATGREHRGMATQCHQGPPILDLTITINDGRALQNYCQTFSYDPAGNLTQISHTGASSWTRRTTIEPHSNRIKTSGLGGEDPPTYAYDRNGNQFSLRGGAELGWNYRDNVQHVTVLVNEETQKADREYYVYDSGGARVRKVTVRQTTGHYDETIYLGTFEIHRRGRLEADGRFGEPTEVWRSLRLMDGQEIAAVWQYWPRPKKRRSPKNLVRYQVNDHLGSSVMELDVDGRMIGYEEYYPYGGTALPAGARHAGVNASEYRQYRYSGKEKDANTGLYYYGARYYAPWLGRWLSPDPAGTVDGLNLYAFVGGNPATNEDIGGLARRRVRAKRRSELGTSHDRMDVDPPTERKRKRKEITSNTTALPQKRVRRPEDIDQRTARKKTGDKRKREEGTSDTAARPQKRARGGKQKTLEELGELEPNKTPMQILKEHPLLLVRKVDPNVSGEHSPSAVNLNRATDDLMAVLGRGHSKLKEGKDVRLRMKADEIPTFQFRRPSGAQIVPGKEAHSITTSLRATAGVGEHTELPLEEILDKTLQAYRGPVHLLSNPQEELRVALYNKGKKTNLIHKPVATSIAQAAVNMWLRGSVKKGEPLANLALGGRYRQLT